MKIALALGAGAIALYLVFRYSQSIAPAAPVAASAPLAPSNTPFPAAPSAPPKASLSPLFGAFTLAPAVTVKTANVINNDGSVSQVAISPAAAAAIAAAARGANASTTTYVTHGLVVTEEAN